MAGSVKLLTPSGGSVTIDTADTASALSINLPAVSDTITTNTATQTLTNKTLTNPILNGFTGDTSVINIGSGQFYKDTSGNLGLGVTPSAWGTDASYKVIQMPGGSFAAYMAGGLDPTPNISANGYRDAGGTWRYINSRAASWYLQNGGMHIWYNAPSGTAGNAISFTQAMTLDANGNLGLGTSSVLGKMSVQTAAGSSFSVRDSSPVTGVTGVLLENWNSPSATNTIPFAVRASQFQFGTDSGGTFIERMRLDSSGRLTVPSQPTFSAGGSTASTTSGQVAPFSVATLNIGSCYNTSTYRFTAPIAGVYYFGVYGIMGPDGTNTAVLQLRKNGGTIATMHRNTSTYNFAWEQGAMFLHVSMAVNDYVDVYISSGTLYLDSSSYYSGFTGRLVG